MPGQMSKTQRVQAALSGEPVDRVPVSAWWHDYKREWSAHDLAEMTLEAYRKYDWDFVKVNPRYSYYAEPWGAEYQRYDDRLPTIATRAVESPEDLGRIQPLDGVSGAWGEQLEALDGSDAPDFGFQVAAACANGVGHPGSQIVNLAGDRLQTRARRADQAYWAAAHAIGKAQADAVDDRRAAIRPHH